RRAASRRTPRAPMPVRRRAGPRGGQGPRWWSNHALCPQRLELVGWDTEELAVDVVVVLAEARRTALDRPVRLGEVQREPVDPHVAHGAVVRDGPEAERARPDIAVDPVFRPLHRHSGDAGRLQAVLQRVAVAAGGPGADAGVELLLGAGALCDRWHVGYVVAVVAHERGKGRPVGIVTARDRHPVVVPGAGVDT